MNYERVPFDSVRAMLSFRSNNVYDLALPQAKRKSFFLLFRNF